MSEQELVVGVGGMTCGHCEASVRDALSRLTGVTAVEADREAAVARIRHAGELHPDEVAAAIDRIGFDFEGVR